MDCAYEDEYHWGAPAMFLNYDEGIYGRSQLSGIDEWDKSITWDAMLSFADQDDAHYILLDQRDDTTSLCDAIDAKNYSVWLRGARQYSDRDDVFPDLTW